jgi:hypothetical protein
MIIPVAQAVTKIMGQCEPRSCNASKHSDIPLNGSGDDQVEQGRSGRPHNCHRQRIADAAG